MMNNAIQRLANTDLRVDDTARQEVINERRIDLLSAGFTDEFIAIVEKNCSTLYGTVKELIEYLQKRGFDNPQKMITSSPAILGLNIDNIDQKIDIIHRVTTIFSVDISPMKVIEHTLSILGTKNDKLWTIIRLLKECNHIPSISEINTLIFAKIDHLVLALQNNANMNTYTKLIQAMKVLKKEACDSKALLQPMLPTNKILLRYARGYNRHVLRSTINE